MIESRIGKWTVKLAKMIWRTEMPLSKMWFHVPSVRLKIIHVPQMEVDWKNIILKILK
jgi:hypothetical protein